MSIAEKLTTIAENEQRVYEAGKNIENKRFWHTIQTKLGWVSYVGWVESRRTNYNYAFRQWYTATEINPLYPIEADGVTYMFESCQSITKHPPITFLQALSTYAMFNGCRELKEANGDFRLTGNVGAMFNGCLNITKINKLIIEGVVYWQPNTFGQCKKLVELKVEGAIDTDFYLNDCESLSMASIDGVIGKLSSEYQGYTNTLTLSRVAVNKAYETEPGKNDGEQSDAWYARTTLSPSNWNIALV